MSDIDIKEHLPRGASVISPWRMQHGDMDGRIDGEGKEARVTAAWCKDNTIARKLIETGFIDEYHLAYGLTLLELKNAFLAPLQVKLNILTDVFGAADIPKKYAVRMYQDITRTLGLPHLRIVEYACDSPYLEEMHIMAKIGCRKAFEALVPAVDEAVAAIKGEIEEKGFAND